MSAEDFRAQVRELLARHLPTGRSGGEGGQGVCVPLRLGGAGDLGTLAELVRRVAVSPALAAAHAAGLLRFELRIDPSMSVAAAAPDHACCEGCARGDACRRAHMKAEPATAATPLLRGVVTERDVRALPADCSLVGTAPRTVLTPLARDALRQRGIAVHAPKEA